eukprot:CAMPEP_0202807338 /NCGR_PEP_ID=MMETSP1389-20130828/35_1 /ASSEMBLY_ACC=CAM_ASM_000865 /TAXON_ID=302021 /ORGANISM="Rhodomonas sp., Strain CCMP768" /LENGTH=33 /DNA_ID= /DNA_START= /DNA_END= /DNA_ORIENTATION=
MWLYVALSVDLMHTSACRTSAYLCPIIRNGLTE